MCQVLVALWLSLTLEPISNKCSVIFCLLYFNFWRSDTRTRKLGQVDNSWIKTVCSSPAPCKGIFLGFLCFSWQQSSASSPHKLFRPHLFLLITFRQLGKNKLPWWLSLRVLSLISVNYEEIIAGPDSWWVLSRIYNLCCKNCQRWNSLDEGAVIQILGKFRKYLVKWKPRSSPNHLRLLFFPRGP